MFAMNYMNLLLLILSIDYCKSDCKTEFSKLQNILLLQNNQIVYTNDGKNIVIKNGDSIDVACPGTTIEKYNIEQKDFRCLNNKYSDNIEKLRCAKNIQAQEIRVGSCMSRYDDIRIRFQFQKSSLTLDEIQVCWDDGKKSVIYTYATLSKTIANKCPASRPDYKSNYFPNNLADYYKKDNQRDNKDKNYKPLGKEEMDALLQKGHLTAFCDFPYEVQQKATNFYTNIAPQWSTFNTGNWVSLEYNVRNLLHKSQTDLEVYSGTYGIMKLNNKDYYLDAKNNLAPVPRYFWKVLIQRKGNSVLGIAIVGSNDIFDKKQNGPCKDMLSKVKWLNLKDAKDIKKGYTVACSVVDFKNIPGIQSQLPSFPPFSGDLLDY